MTPQPPSIEQAGSAPAEDESSGYNVPKYGKEFKIPTSEPVAFMVEVAQWDRISRRVSKKDRPRDWVLAIASSSMGIGVSALIAVLAIPKSTDPDGLEPWIKPCLWVITVAFLTLGIVFIAVYCYLGKVKEDRHSDICDEMETIKKAWM